MANFYRTKQWKRKRSNILKRDEYQCRECKRYGKVTTATIAHHCYPLDKYPEYKLDSRTLISLCGTCHNQMHDRITDELTDKGLKWMERISPLLND
ncbi:HNH endonuclease [Aquibacillus kalidii]|uniref:HNH endonuclease n=1 Tax=Aquibacillus kalidii TaxID=2762597 RepID=UPI0016488593|nr:HNH endonuclease [Aquibacillus kalidii]